MSRMDVKNMLSEWSRVVIVAKQYDPRIDEYENRREDVLVGECWGPLSEPWRSGCP